MWGDTALTRTPTDRFRVEMRKAFNPTGSLPATLKEVWRFVKSKRMQACPNVGFVARLQELEMRTVRTIPPTLSQDDIGRPKGQ